MGFFHKKILGEEEIIGSLLITFGQAIDATEKSNGIEIPEAWDLFMNKVALLIDAGIISEQGAEAIIHLSRFQSGVRSLVVDLNALRVKGPEVATFAEKYQRLMELKFDSNLVFRTSGLHPNDFIEFLVEISKPVFPKFGSIAKDQKFYAVLGIFFATVFKDTDDSRKSEKTSRRYSAFTLGLQWYAEWNFANEIF